MTRQKLMDEIVALVAQGNHVETACAAVGISTNSYYRWRVMGREVEALVASQPDADQLREALGRGERVLDLTELQVAAWDFTRRIRMAQAMSEAYVLMLIKNAQPRTWRAAMTYLERRFPGRWRRRRGSEFEDADAVPAGPGGIDEAALLADPDAVRILHEVLRIAAGPAQPVDELAEANARIGSRDEMRAWMRPVSRIRSPGSWPRDQ